MKVVSTILQVSIHREGNNPVFGEGNTYVRVEDDAAGPYIVMEQSDDDSRTGMVRFDYDELEAAVDAAKMLMHQMYIEKAALNK